VDYHAVTQNADHVLVEDARGHLRIAHKHTQQVAPHETLSWHARTANTAVPSRAGGRTKWKANFLPSTITVWPACARVNFRN
jgi:hypothetical protein